MNLGEGKKGRKNDYLNKMETCRVSAALDVRGTSKKKAARGDRIVKVARAVLKQGKTRCQCWVQSAAEKLTAVRSLLDVSIGGIRHNCNFFTPVLFGIDRVVAQTHTNQARITYLEDSAFA